MGLDGAEVDFPLLDQPMDHMPDFAPERPTDDRLFAQFPEHPRHPDSLTTGVHVYFVAFIRANASTVTVRVNIGANTATV